MKHITLFLYVCIYLILNTGMVGTICLEDGKAGSHGYFQ